MDSHEVFFVGTFTALLFAATVFLWRSTDKLWRAGENQTVVIQRAFVFSRKIDVRVSINPQTNLYVRCLISKEWENSGTTPAINVSMRENTQAFVGDIPDDFDFPDHPDNPIQNIVLGPKARILGRGILVPPDDCTRPCRGKRDFTSGDGLNMTTYLRVPAVTGRSFVMN
jgi:hypothetical protein